MEAQGAFQMSKAFTFPIFEQAPFSNKSLDARIEFQTHEQFFALGTCQKKSTYKVFSWE